MVRCFFLVLAVGRTQRPTQPTVVVVPAAVETATGLPTTWTSARTVARITTASKTRMTAQISTMIEDEVGHERGVQTYGRGAAV